VHVQLLHALDGSTQQLCAPPRRQRIDQGQRLDRVRVRVEIMGPVKYEIVGKSQSLLMMSKPMIFTRTRSNTQQLSACGCGGRRAAAVGATSAWRARTVLVVAPGA
jgi:hypothetical protein